MRHLRLGLIAIFLVSLGAGSAWAWGNSSNCVGCHSTMNPLNGDGALHSAHAAGLVTDCGWCHPSGGGLPVLTNESELDPDNSCTGCHSLGGLYAIHTAANCGCHAADPPPAGLESDKPPYYGTAATTFGTTRQCWDELDNDGDGDVDGADQDCIGVPNEWKSWSTIKEHYGE